jgi:hypothetical protein
MSGRTTRASKAALSNSAPSSSQDKPSATKVNQGDDSFEADVQVDKENRVAKGAKGNGKGSSSTKTKSKKGATKVPEVFCACRREDDGTPMVYCGECQDWYVYFVDCLIYRSFHLLRYHFSCVNLSEREAEDISK